MKSGIANQSKKDFVRLIQRMSGKYSPRDIFTDFCYLARISLANTIERNPKRETTYNNILSKYDGKVEPFSELLAYAVQAYECEICDFLGECYEDLNIQNTIAGQFFTPYSVSYLMAKATIDKAKAKAAIEQKGYVSMNDCACGAGCTLLAGLDVLKNECGINYQRQSLVIAQDIDDACAAMCYVQLALLGAPAIIQTTNTITDPNGGTRWYTPFYWLNAHKFRAWEGVEAAREILNMPVPAPDTSPTPAPARKEPKIIENEVRQLDFGF